MITKFIFCLFVFLFVIFANAEKVRLQIDNGILIGKTGNTVRQNKLWYMFLGIPYAEPPVRFELSVMKKSWVTPIDCTFDKPQCVQGGVTTPVVGQEDCLTLSVYSPDLNGSYPVFVWIHGGYFSKGNASYANQAPDLLVEEGIVFVEIQYRLGVFGFLSTEDNACPGNLGLKDQSLALRWVQNNIKYFGGNPNKVTLGGQSAGSVSVSLHLLSPQSKGLFHAAILNSGTALSLWSYIRRARQIAFSIGRTLLIPAFTSSQLIAGLKSKKYDTLQKASSLIASTAITLQNPLAGLWFGYVAEPDHPNAFFRGKAESRFAAGDFTKVPIMLGITSNESIFFGNITSIIRAYLLNFALLHTKLVPADLNANLLCQVSSGEQIKSHYFGHGLLATSSSTSIFDFVSADQFNRPVVQTAVDISKYLPDDLYFYEFSFMGQLGSAKKRAGPGVGHEEDLNYLFFRNTDNNISKQEYVVTNQVVRLWANFVKYHNPTPVKDPLLKNLKWIPFRNSHSNDTNYLNINTTLEMLTNPKNGDIEFYRGIYTACGKENYDTY